jgi:amino acid adenylation domain-containing protein
VGFLLQHLLRDAAARRPEATAALFEGEALSYAELERQSDGLARTLLEQGVRRGDRVALALNKSLGSLVATHGILKAGASYVPLDPNAPAQRLAWILGNCGVRHLVASTRKGKAIQELAAGGARLEAVAWVDDAEAPRPPEGARSVPWAEVQAAGAAGAPPCASIEDDLAYILYTSGSTGTPKGVMISHRNALAFVNWAVAELGVTPADRLSSHAPLHFDLSIFDLFAAMEAGASVALVPDGTSTFPVRLAEWIQRSGITIWYSVPSILTLLLLKGKLDRTDLARLRLVLFAGEVFPTKYLRDVMRALPRAAFVNLYGPTETNVITWYRVPPLAEGRDEPIPIGRACANTELFVVDEAGGRIEAPGVPGELYARGPSVAQGYWADPEKTARGFVANPFQPHYAGRVYRTGDVVALEPDGNLRLLGRRDRMIKSRGYRIELDEIETVLYAHPEVKEAAVVAVPDELIGNRIRAFVAPAQGSALGGGALREHCLARLPRYMLPEAFELLPELPKTSTGKVDRTRLAQSPPPPAREA